MRKLEAHFSEGVNAITLENLTQWDKDVLLHISGEGMPEVFEIHIGYEGISKAYRFPVATPEETTTIVIPDVLLQQTRTIKAWVYAINTEGCRTEKTITIPVFKRERPADYESSTEPTQKDAIEQLIISTNELIESTNELAEVAKMILFAKASEANKVYFLTTEVNGGEIAAKAKLRSPWKVVETVRKAIESGAVNISIKGTFHIRVNGGGSGDAYLMNKNSNSGLQVVVQNYRNLDDLCDKLDIEIEVIDTDNFTKEKIIQYGIHIVPGWEFV